MKTYRTLIKSALLGFAALAGLSARADNMASIAIAPGTGTVTLTPQWGIGGNLAGFHLMAQDLSLGGGANQFYSIKGTPIPNGGDITAFTRYIAASGAATDHTDIGSKLTPNSYSALTSADPDLGYGAVQLYFIHHKTDGDYFSHIVPSSGTASAVTDLKPMSQPGGPSTGGLSGYYGLTFAAVNLNYGSNIFYYLRTNQADGHTKFGTLIPALAGASADQFDLGTGTGYNALAFTGTDVGYGINKMYTLRLDSVTGFTILGLLNPGNGNVADIANLGSVFSTLTFVPGDVGFGTGRFYTTGPINATWQSVSFAAVPDAAISAGSFTVTPTASSTLPIALTVVPGSVGAASISGPVAGVFTVRPTAPGFITLQATQAGQVLPAYEYNMLRQSFTITGVATLQFTAQPTSQSAVTGTTATISAVASGTTAVTYQWRKAGANISGNASATTATLSLTNVQAADAASYDVVATNTSGSIISNAVTLTVTTAAPVITNSPLTAGGTVGAAFSFTITASGSPTSYSATPLPAGLSVSTTTGAITGTPTTAGSTSVLLGATSASGTGNATLTITVAAAGVAPIINNNPLTAGGTVGSAFNFAISASGSPTSYSATPLPAGLSIAAGTGIITGTPTTVGSTSVLLGATNASGTGNATLTITVAAAGVAPVVTNNPLTAAGTVGTPFSFTITASGSPTSYSASPLPAGLSIVATTGAITGTPTTAGSTSVLLGATNASGTGNATLTITVAAAGVAPIVTNSPLTAGGTAGTPFSFTITASGSPTSYSASPLPAGLSIVAATGAITGTPTTPGSTSVLLGATNGSGTGNATLTITIGAAGVAPVITNNPLSAGSTVNTPFSFTITASGSATSYAASPLPPGLTIVAATGAITGTPTTAGTTSVLLSATNTSGTGNATLTITISAAGVAPVITNTTLTAGATIGSPFSFTIAASGSPTTYAASPLPPGLSVVAATGVITGTPTTAGVTSVTLSATNASGTGSATLAITVVAAGSNPVINNTLTASAAVGTPFSFTITAAGSPTSYAATPLPAGLSFASSTGVISGTPTTVGVTAVVIGATNSSGTGTATLTITVSTVPTITNSFLTPTTAATGVGFNYIILASGSPTSFTASPLPAGLSINSTTGIISGTPTTAGTTIVTLRATNTLGSSTAVLTIVVSATTPAPTAPVISSPATASGALGTAIVPYSISTGGSVTSYTATGLPPGLTLNTSTGVISGTPTTAGTYSVVVTATNSGGTGTKTIVITVAATSSRIVNFSARALSGPGSQTLIVGFVVEGNGKNVLIRGIGPSLSRFGVTNTLADPMLTLYGTSSAIAVNDDWQVPLAQPSGSPIAADGTLIASTSSRVGAFALLDGSKDAALMYVFNNGAHTTSMVRPNSTTGVALTELYDLDTTASSRLVNVSARMNVTAGEGTLIAGLVISGNAPKTVLIRGVGPTLANFGVTGVLADPVITVYSAGAQVAVNDNWESGASTAAQINTASARVGAFALVGGSKDAALLITLQPGAYSVKVSGVADTTGVALIEVYDTE